MDNLDKNWESLVARLEKQFDDEMTLKEYYTNQIRQLGIKGLVGEKLNVLHVATCKLLSGFGYYKFVSVDEDGWPHYKEVKAIKNLNEKEQENLIKKAIINYIN